MKSIYILRLQKVSLEAIAHQCVSFKYKLHQALNFEGETAHLRPLFPRALGLSVFLLG